VRESLKDDASLRGKSRARRNRCDDSAGSRAIAGRHLVNRESAGRALGHSKRSRAYDEPNPRQIFSEGGCTRRKSDPKELRWHQPREMTRGSDTSGSAAWIKTLCANLTASNWTRCSPTRPSGKDTKRPQLQAVLEYLREGDTLVVHSMDRLARNMDDLKQSCLLPIRALGDFGSLPPSEETNLFICLLRRQAFYDEFEPIRTSRANVWRQSNIGQPCFPFSASRSTRMPLQAVCAHLFNRHHERRTTSSS
jgi:Resolvase, N terminal domain